MSTHKFKPWALGASIGIVWGGSVFITTFISYYTGYGREFLNAFAVSIYPGYEITPLRSFLGLLYGFLDGLLSGALVGWLYNKISGRD